MKKNTNYKWTLRIGFIVIILGAVLAKPIYTIFTSQDHWSKNEIAEYKDLFTDESQKNLSLFNTIESKLREPESQYIYNKKYNVFVTKIRISPKFNLDTSVKIGNETSKIENNEVYFPIRSLNSDINIKSGKTPLITGIKIKIEGVNFSIVNKNNDGVFYSYQFKTFSLNFNDDQSYIVATSAKSNTPANIALIKKNNFLYVVLLTVAEGREELQADQLYNILKR